MSAQGEWRLLSVGEVIAEGDELYGAYAMEWEPVIPEDIGSPVAEADNPFRRRNAPVGGGEFVLVPRTLLAELASDLRAEVAAHYDLPHRIERDMRPVKEAEAILAAPAPTEGPRISVSLELCTALVRAVEGTPGIEWLASGHRLKDQPEWVRFYNATKAAERFAEGVVTEAQEAEAGRAAAPPDTLCDQCGEYSVSATSPCPKCGRFARTAEPALLRELRGLVEKVAKKRWNYEDDADRACDWFADELTALADRYAELK